MFRGVRKRGQDHREPPRRSPGRDGVQLRLNRRVAVRANNPRSEVRV
jgi:hypothetical protein